MIKLVAFKAATFFVFKKYVFYSYKSLSLFWNFLLSISFSTFLTFSNL